MYVRKTDTHPGRLEENNAWGFRLALRRRFQIDGWIFNSTFLFVLGVEGNGNTETEYKSIKMKWNINRGFKNSKKGWKEL